MPLHLIKLCVGVNEVEEMRSWIKINRKSGETLDHVTRAFPRRAEEILPGGSLYWVIRGAILCRQPLKSFEAVRGEDGIERCRIIFKPEIILVRPTPRRAFQGWRYFEDADVPPDMPRGSAAADMSPKMRKELAELGLL